MFGKKTIRIAGVAYTISKLSPMSFVEDDYFPVSHVIEKLKGKIDSNAKLPDGAKETMQKVIEKSLVKASFYFKRLNKDAVLKRIMEVEEIYSYLFVEIVSFAFDKKKRTFLLV